jgi:hypothetical protein
MFLTFSETNEYYLYMVEFEETEIKMVSRSIPIQFYPIASSILGFIRKTNSLEATYLWGLSEGLGDSDISDRYYPSSGFAYIDEESSQLLDVSSAISPKI